MNPISLSTNLVQLISQAGIMMNNKPLQSLTRAKIEHKEAACGRLKWTQELLKALNFVFNAIQDKLTRWGHHTLVID